MACECALDKKCSRFIQDRIDNPQLDIRERRKFYDKILASDNQISFDQLAMNENANYIIQKILKQSDQ